MRGEDLYGFRRPCPENLFLAARMINDFMPRHVDYLLRTAIRAIPGAVPRQVHDINLAILGWSFIANSGDTRNSPSEVLFGCVRGLKSVRVHDPYVDPKTVTVTSVSDNIELVLLGADAVVVMTGHPMYGKLEPEWVKLLCDCEHPVIIDGRNVIDADSFIRSGFIYRGIGRGDKNSHAVCNPSII
jgi:UDP-N-acetyl-D-mannosaminuronic acid dehydrogenase